MTDTSAILSWLEGYVTAWETDAAEDIAALFANDACYYPTPYSAPLVGVDAIVAWWIDQKNSKIQWTFVYDIVAREADTYVVRGVTRYPPGQESADAKVYRNIWIVTLDSQGKATEFIEYWMLER